MQLLGNYASNLTAFLYQELLNQLETSISLGEYAAGQLFDTSAAQAIQAEGQNFTTITIPTAGDTAYAEDINTPLDSLQARYTAILNEVTELNGNVGNLLTLIDKEASLIDQIIAAAEAEAWAALQPPVAAANRIVWGFASGHGNTTTVYPAGKYNVDPSNNVMYPSSVPQISYVIDEALGGNGSIVGGLSSPASVKTVPVKQLQWVYIPSSPQTQFEEVYSEDQSWTYLAALEPAPLLTAGPPNIAVTIPIGGSAAGIFQVFGTVPGGSLPVYVRILFYPRQNLYPVTNGVSGATFPLSIYSVTVNTVQVFNSIQVFLLGADYLVDDSGNFTIVPTGSLVGANFTILFQEFYPAYQCSINQTNWSPVFMLDPNRPYPDDTTNFLPIDIQNSRFPLTDELGVPLGLFIQMVGVPLGAMVLEVTTPRAQIYGENAQLNVSLERAIYANGLQLEPFTNFPVTIQRVVAVGFTTNMRSTILDIPFILDRSVIVKFPRQLVRSFEITLYQPNYELKEYIVEPPDSQRRDVLAALQASLPFSVQRPQPSTPQRFEGAMYEMGLESLAAVDSEPILPGVFVSGPYRILGQPEVIRLDSQIINMPQTPKPAVYLAFLAYNGNDEEIDQGEFAMAPGTTIPYPSILVADHVDFFVKYVFREELSVAEKLLLQVSTA